MKFTGVAAVAIEIRLFENRDQIENRDRQNSCYQKAEK